MNNIGPIKITVLEEDIDPKTRGNAAECPVSRAIRRALNVSVELSIFGNVYVVGNEQGMRGYAGTRDFEIPLDVVEIITHFDQTGEMTPFVFEINDIEEYSGV